MANARGKVTLQSIADMAGVSKFAVSRALSGKSGVSAKTRERILKTAGELGYFKNNEPMRAGGELREYDGLQRQGTIVVLFPNVRYQNKESLYWGPVFDGVSARLSQRGLDIITLTEPSGDSLFTLLKPEAIQGIVTIGAISTSLLLDIGRMEIPVVMVDHQDPAFRCDTVFTDNFSSMKELVTKLVSKGYRKFQFVGNIKHAPSFQDRWLAYRTVLESYQIELNQDPELIGPDANDMYVLFSKRKLKELPDVFVCSHDANAGYLIDELRKMGFDVPRDCAVTGFDGTCGTQHPILGTVNVDKELLGARAVDQLLWRILNRDSAVERKLIFGDVIIREEYAYSGHA